MGSSLFASPWLCCVLEVFYCYLPLGLMWIASGFDFMPSKPPSDFACPNYESY